MTEAEKRRAEAIWTYRISQEKVLKRLVEKGIFTQEHADYIVLDDFHKMEGGKEWI